MAQTTSYSQPPSKDTTVILVDKKTNTLSVAKYKEEGYQILKSYHATVGKVKGDKVDQDDLKTPEGVYSFTAHLTPPTLKKKFGAMAFYMNYPNVFDRLAGNTGFDIMLHATNEPERLERDYDSQGCIVVKDEEITEIKPYIRLALTPILVFDHLTPEYMKPADDRLKAFFNAWIGAWEKKDIEGYISHYHSAFVSDGRDRAAWKAYKDSLNRKYETIHVGPESVHYYRHPKYSVVRFGQNYESRTRDGRVAFRSQGTKTLYVAEEDGQLKIIEEDYTPLKW